RRLSLLRPALQRMLKANLIKSEWEISATNRKVRTYRITPAGVKHLKREVSGFEQMLKGSRSFFLPSIAPYFPRAPWRSFWALWVCLRRCWRPQAFLEWLRIRFRSA
ncbi:MAG: helix-turn-helix transcriptional regulator, partial [Rhodanobacteraceae bacterium]